MVMYFGSFLSSRSTMKKNIDFDPMSADELWGLYETVSAELRRKIATARDLLDARLRRLGLTADGELQRRKRPYPKVSAKYRNSNNHGQTWTGRGRQPRWLAAEIRSGKKLTDFLIG
jgi:DNA-binding protein H-NS